MRIIETVQKILSTKNLYITTLYNKEKDKWMWALKTRAKDGVIIDELYYSNSVTIIYLVSDYCFATEEEAKVAGKKLVEDLKKMKTEINNLNTKLENIRKKYSEGE